ncbi:MAG: DUF3298 domain-containing protein [Lachnospiraceae bacterium]|nr:DUF3298 domain-containing protein [Lachnospiraceae bacterium]
MKRSDLITKITAILLTCMMVPGTMACSFGEKTPELPTEPETVAEPEQPAEEPASPGSSSGKTGGSDYLGRLRDMTSGGENALPDTSDDTYILQRSTGNPSFFTVSSTGEVIRSVDYAQLEEQMKAHSEPYIDIYDPAGQYACSTIAADDGRFLYFHDYIEPDEETGYCYVVYAIDTTDYTPYLLWQSNPDDGSFLDCSGFYDGLFRFTVSYGKDPNGNFYGKEEMAYRFDEDKKQFVPEDTGIGEVFDAAKRWNVNILAPTGYDMNGRESFSQAIAECGWVLGVDDDGFYQVMADGTVNDLDLGLESYFYIPLYDSEKIYYSMDDEDESTKAIYAYDLKSQTTERISGHIPSITLLGLQKGILYYSYNDTETYGLTHNYICSYDSETGRTESLYDLERKPGASYEPGTEGFRLIGGQPYFADFDSADHALKWVRVDETGGKAAFTDIGATIETIDIFDYGTIECDSIMEKCPFCGIPLIERYGECLVLDPSVSPKADVINSFLKEKMQEFVHVSESGDDTAAQDDSECEYHKESPWQYCMTDDLNVTGVHMIGDHYMTVDMYGYWYGGGAHGYPNRNQYLFDLDTGELKTIADFYTGTEEEFKTLLAEKTKEDALSYSSDDSPYFSSEDPDSIYDQAYDEAGIETSNIEFLDDGIIVIYPPYDMGSYAAGFIEIFISYKELLGRDSL